MDVVIPVKAVDGASGVFQKVAKELRAMRKESFAAGDNAFESTFSSAENMTKALLDKLGVGLAGAAIQIAGDQLSKVTGKLVEIRDRMNEGKTSAAELALEFGKSLPILGGIVSTGANIRELFTGEKAAIAEINRETEETIRLSDLRRQSAEEANRQHKEFLATTKAINDEIRLLNTPESKRPAEAIKQDAQKRRDEVLETVAAGEKTPEKVSKQIAALAAERSKIDSRINELGEVNLSAQAGEDRQRIKTELAELQAERTRKQNAIDLANTKEAERRAQVRKDGADKIAAIDKLEAAKLKEEEKKTGTQRVNVATETARRIQKANQETAEKALDNAGRTADAEKLRLKNARDNEIAEAARRRDSTGGVQGLAMFVAEKLAIEQKYAVELDALNKKQSEEKARRDSDRARAGAEASSAERDAEVERQAQLLELQGKTGEAAIVRIKRDGERRIEEIRRQADAEAKARGDLAPEIRRKADADIKKAELETNDRIAKQQKADAYKVEAIVTPSLSVFARSSGAAARAREENSQFQQMIKLQQETKSVIKEGVDAVKDIFKGNPEIVELLGGLA